MIPKRIQCKNCGSDIEVATYRKFTICPYCKTKCDFEGFDYREIDWSDSMYSHVKMWMDCPSCRSKNMYLGSSGKGWKCPDCGYSISRIKKFFGVFWFCDDCESFLNVQEGFNTKGKTWKCTECGFLNNVTKKNIL